MTEAHKGRKLFCGHHMTELGMEGLNYLAINSRINEHWTLNKYTPTEKEYSMYSKAHPEEV